MGDSQGLRFGPFHLQSAQGPLLRDGIEIHLQPKTLRLLWTLARQPGVVVSKADLFDALWPQRAVTETALSFQIQTLRVALGDDPRSPRYITTVHRVGFRFSAPPADGGEAKADGTSAAAPLVGRGAELQRLAEHWRLALSGQRQIVFLSGEAGIGKTAIVERLLAHLRTADPDLLAGCGQNAHASNPGEAYRCVLEVLDQLCRLDRGARVLELLAQWAPSWLAQTANLLTDAERAGLDARSAGITPLRKQRELIDALERLSAELPLVLVLEDLHWSDAPTIELLQLLARQPASMRLLLVCTFRPVDAIVSQHPVNELKRKLIAQGRASELMLAHLHAADVAEYLAQRFPDRAELRDCHRLLHRRTEGLPLFVVQLAAALQNEKIAAVPALIDELVPSGLLEFIEMQAANLPQAEQQLLDAAGVEGLEFTTAGIAAALGIDESEVEVLCDRLSRSGRFVEDRGLAIWPDGTAGGRYAFRHALYQTVFHRRLSAGRRRQMHLALAQRIEAAFGERVHEVAADLARHYESAQQPSKAAQHHLLAGERALQHCVPQSAVFHLQRALELLPAPSDDRDGQARELALHLQLGGALIATRGYTAPAVEQAFLSAERLARDMGDQASLATAQWGLFLFHAIRAEFPAARVFGERLLALADLNPRDSLLQLQARLALGATLLFQGELDAAREQLERGLEFCELPPQAFATMLHAQDLRVDCVATAAWLYWLQGVPERARQFAAHAVALAAERFSANSLSVALYRQGVLSYLMAEPDSGALALSLLRHARDHGLPHWEAAATILHGAAINGVEPGSVERMRQAIELRRSMHVGLGATLDLLLLARTLAAAGERSAAMVVLQDARATMTRTGERLWAAPLRALEASLCAE